MDELYDVYCDNKTVGSIIIQKSGLYYIFSGRFQLEKNKIWRILATTKDRKIDLGICLFDAPYFTISKKMPIKLFDDGLCSFEAICPTDQRKDLIKISDDKPFDSLDGIEQGTLIRKGDDLFIAFDCDH